MYVKYIVVIFTMGHKLFFIACKLPAFMLMLVLREYLKKILLYSVCIFAVESCFFATGTFAITPDAVLTLLFLFLVFSEVELETTF